METGDIIVIIVSLIVIIFPFIIFNRKVKGAKAKAFKALTEYAHQNNFKIEEWGKESNHILGVDINQNIAFYGKITDAETIDFYHTNLADASLCRINRQTRSVQTKEGKEEITQKIELLFIPKSKREETVSFVLFNEDDGTQLANELAFGKEWADKFNRRIK